jgi:hypothetical protein
MRSFASLRRTHHVGAGPRRRQGTSRTAAAWTPSGAVGELLALQRTAGNRAVTALIAQREVATVPHNPMLAEIDSRLAPSVRQALRVDEPRREFLLALYAKLRGYWAHVPPGSITWVGEHAEMDFQPDDEAALRHDLVADGYTSSYFAATGKDTWGLREPGVSAAGLHWRGSAGGRVNVHIDLHPPSGTGFMHWLRDMRQRATTHTPEAVRRGVESLNIEVPVVSQQAAHGQLTVRLRDLEARAADLPDARTDLEMARFDLDGAAAMIWTRDVISNDELAEAICLLVEADIALDSVERRVPGRSRE